MKSLDNLEKGDYIAFAFKFNGDCSKEIIVDNITEIYKNKVLVHFVYGHRSLSEYIKKKDILAIGDNENSNAKIPGWSGKYFILHPRRLNQVLKKY